MKYIIVTGNPVDGFGFWGPYDSHEEAVTAGEVLTPDWWVAPLPGRVS